MVPSEAAQPINTLQSLPPRDWTGSNCRDSRCRPSSSHHHSHDRERIWPPVVTSLAVILRWLVWIVGIMKKGIVVQDGRGCLAEREARDQTALQKPGR